MTERKLIVNADDFGQSRGINEGIIRSYEHGILTSASLMVRYPALAEAAAYAKSRPDLSVGLHVDLGEWAVQQEEWIPLYEVVDLDNPEAVEEEVLRQLESFCRVMGRMPAHIDSHQHVHQRKVLRSFFVSLGRELNVTVRGLGEKVRYCGDFYGQLDDGSAYHNAVSPAALRRTLTNLPEGVTELACHPGVSVEIATMYRDERELEVSTLCDPSIWTLILQEGIELISFEGISFN